MQLRGDYLNFPIWKKKVILPKWTDYCNNWFGLFFLLAFIFEQEQEMFSSLIFQLPPVVLKSVQLVVLKYSSASVVAPGFYIVLWQSFHKSAVFLSQKWRRKELVGLLTLSLSSIEAAHKVNCVEEMLVAL